MGPPKGAVGLLKKIHGFLWISWIMDVLENSDFFGESRISWTFWTRKLGFCSLRAQRVDDQTGYTRRPKSASDSIFRCPGTPDFRPVFGHFGHFSAPAAPLELKMGLSMSISAPL